MRLTADSFRKFYSALLDAFPTYGDLSLLVKTGLGENLAEIVSRDGGLRRQVAELITWADSHDLTDKLLEQARNDRPTNRMLADVTLVYEPGRPDDADRSHLDAPFHFTGVPSFPRYGLLGRDDLLNDLVARLTADSAGPEPIRVAISGTGGVGKTALAVALAYHKDLHATFTGGLLWGSVGPGGDPLIALRAWAAELGLDPAHYPDPGDLKTAVKNRIAKKKLLLVLDDIWDADHAGLLRCGGPHCAHLLTARSNRIARTFAGRDQALVVPHLGEDPAFVLLQAIAPGAVAADETLARDLLARVGGLPLAVELLGGYLTQESAGEHDIFADLGREDLAAFDPTALLEQAQAKLEDAAARKVRLADLLALSLDGFSDDDAAAFDALGAFAPQPATFSRAAAETASGANGRLLRRLVNRNLLEVSGERLAIHQVTHNLAGRRLEESEQLDDARARHAAYYLALVNEDRNDWRRIDAAYDQIRWAWEHTADGNSVDWVYALSTFQGLRGYWQEKTAWLERALAAARRGEDRHDESWVINELALTYHGIGRVAEALRYYEEALPIVREVGNRAGEATTLKNMGGVYDATGRPQEALARYEEALPIVREVGNRAGEAATLANMAVLLAQMERAPQAIERLIEGTAVMRETGLTHDAAGQTLAQYEAFLQKLQSGEPLSAPAQGQAADELQQALAAFVNAEDWDASRQVLEAQQELLLSTRSDERLAMQIEEFKAQDNQELAGVLQKHKDLLLRCREIGITEAFAELGPP